MDMAKIVQVKDGWLKSGPQPGLEGHLGSIRTLGGHTLPLNTRGQLSQLEKVGRRAAGWKYFIRRSVKASVLCLLVVFAF